MTDQDLIRREDAITLLMMHCQASQFDRAMVNLRRVNAATPTPALDAPAPDKVARLVDYVLQDDLHNRLTPRVVDIAYCAFMLGRSGKNKDDGGPCDWFNDTRPMVMAKIGEIRTALKGGDA